MSVNQAQEDRARLEGLLTEEAYQLAWRYCCSLAASVADAEDLLQDALLQALSRIAQLRDPAAFRSWLLAIVRRRFSNRLRRQRQEAATRPALLAWVSAAGADGMADTAALALARLPAEQRGLLALFYLEGFSMQELARSLGISRLAVQGRLARARGAMKRELLALYPAMAPRAAGVEHHA